MAGGRAKQDSSGELAKVVVGGNAREGVVYQVFENCGGNTISLLQLAAFSRDN